MGKHADRYVLDRVIFPTDDGPGFGTPCYTHVDHGGLYIQDYELKRAPRITGFLPVTIGHAAESIVWRSNSFIGVGWPLQYALRLSDESVQIGDQSDLRRLASDRIDVLRHSPFLLFQLARVVRSKEMLLEAIGSAVLVDALKSSEIVLQDTDKLWGRRGWDQQGETALKILWRRGLSAAQIGAILGFSRYAVIGKIHRLGLGNQHSSAEFGEMEADIGESDVPVPKRRGWWTLGGR